MNRIKPYIAPLIVFIPSLALRFVYFSHLRLNQLLMTPFADARYYYDWALSIAKTGDLLGKGPFFLNPGYPYLLALLLKIFDYSIPSIILFQFVVGALSAVLVYCISKKFLPVRFSVTAGILYGVCSVPMFYEGFLLTFVWITLFNLIAMLSVLNTEGKNAWKWLALAGLNIGLSAIFRPNILLLVPLCVGWMWFYTRESIFKSLLIFFLPIFLVLAPVIIRNVVVLGEPVISSVSTGINLYIGNSEHSDGSNMAIFKLAPLASSPKHMLDTFKQLAEKDSKISLSYSQVDRYWERQSLNWIYNNKARSLHNLVNKFLLFVNAREIESNVPFYLTKKVVFPLAFCPGVGWFIPFAVVGFFVFWRDKNSMLLRAFFAVQITTVLIIFMLSEYRAPVIPVLVIFAMAGAYWLYGKAKQKDYQGISIASCFFFVLVFISNWNRASAATAGSTLWEGRYAMQAGDYMKAEELFRKSISIDRSNVAGYQYLGILYFSKGQFTLARQCFEKTISISPTTETYISLGTIALRQNDATLAKKNFEKAVLLDVGDSRAIDGLACAEFLLGAQDRSYQLWEHALHIVSDEKQRSMILTNVALAAKQNKKFNELIEQNKGG